MAGYYTFTSTRTTEPDVPSLLASLRAQDATIGITEHASGTATYKLKKNTDWSAQQIAAAQTLIDTAPETTAQMTYQRTSRQKDVLATCALIVRARNITAWNAMTAVQKRDAAFAEADIWANIRDFVETNA